MLVTTEESIRPRSPSWRVQLDMSTLDPNERVQPTAFTPCKPLPQLERIEAEGVGAPGVPGEVGDRPRLGGRHCCWLERQNRCRSGHNDHLTRRPTPVPTSPAANTARHLEPVEARPSR